MIGLLCFVVAVLASPFRSKIRLEVDNAALRHQLVVLRRKLKGRPRVTRNDRWFFVQLYRWFPSTHPRYVAVQVDARRQDRRQGQERLACSSRRGRQCP